MLETLQAGKGAQSPAISVAGVHYAPVLAEINRIYAEKVRLAHGKAIHLLKRQFSRFFRDQIKKLTHPPIL